MDSGEPDERPRHVIPNPDGSKARCGGPALCPECARERKVGMVTVLHLSDDEIAARLEQKGISAPTIAEMLRHREDFDVATLIDDLLTNREWDG